MPRLAVAACRSLSWCGRVLLPILAALVASLDGATGPSAEGATPLETFAASMTPGTWGALTTNQIDPTLTDPTVVSGHVLDYASEGALDPVGRRAYFVGSGHNGSARLVQYDAESNSWSIPSAQPPWALPFKTSHGYDNST